MARIGGGGVDSVGGLEGLGRGAGAGGRKESLVRDDRAGGLGSIVGGDGLVRGAGVGNVVNTG